MQAQKHGGEWKHAVNFQKRWFYFDKIIVFQSIRLGKGFQNVVFFVNTQVITSRFCPNFQIYQQWAKIIVLRSIAMHKTLTCLRFNPHLLRADSLLRYVYGSAQIIEKPIFEELANGTSWHEKISLVRFKIFFNFLDTRSIQNRTWQKTLHLDFNVLLT